LTKQDLISALRESVPGRSPLVGFAAADDPLFRENKRVVSPAHALPEDLLPGARTVVAFFIPLPRAAARWAELCARRGTAAATATSSMAEGCRPISRSLTSAAGLLAASSMPLFSLPWESAAV